MLEVLRAMKASELQNIFIDELKVLLPDWRFVKSQRQFKRVEEGVVWLFHINCINHLDDFDAVADVAVEFKSGKENICIVGAELGNIEGVGQKRFSVTSATEAKSSAERMLCYFKAHGMPFLRKYSNPVDVISTLKQGGKEAMLISPLLNQHPEQINRLTNFYGVSI
ncbi:hypothetical protein [Litoribrevibacter albus]|uniref:hypothetical protein n=1 Tax=Litoribrevibacter albus TaxID=1473156 RepID=UPI0024E0C3BE|nr:hypothetical protein [Litoribrevibacter albus]